MAKARIKSKTGALITIEGTDAEVSNIISMIEKTTAVGQAKQALSKSRATRDGEKKKSAASDLIVELKEEGFFEKPKSLGDVASALEEKGYLYPTTSLSGVVLGLVQRRLLRRKKAEGKWVYGK